MGVSLGGYFPHYLRRLKRSQPWKELEVEGIGEQSKDRNEEKQGNTCGWHIISKGTVQWARWYSICFLCFSLIPEYILERRLSTLYRKGNKWK